MANMISRFLRLVGSQKPTRHKKGPQDRRRSRLCLEVLEDRSVPTTGLTLSPMTLTDATANSAYSATISVTGGSGMDTFVVSSGTLPTGITLGSTTGVLAGTATTAVTDTFTIEATDDSNSSLTGSQAYTLKVDPAASLTLAPTTLADATANTGYTATVTATGGSGTYTYALATGSSLPSGLALNVSTGAVTGTATTAAAATFTIDATDTSNSSLTGSQAYTLNVDPASSLTLSPTTLPAVTANSAYTATITATGGSGTYTFTLANGATLPTGLSLSTSGVISGTTPTATSATFTVDATDTTNSSLTGSQQYTLTINSAPTLTLSPTTLSPVTADTNIDTTISATGGEGTYSFAVATGSTLPTGLSLDGTTGVLSGTVTVVGTYDFSVTATDSSNTSLTGTQAYTLSVTAANTLTLSPTLPVPTLDNAYSGSANATGGSGTYTYAVTAGSLPSWATLNTSTGLITGTPPALGSSTFTITATDSVNNSLTGSQQYTLNVGVLANGTISGTVYNTAHSVTVSGETVVLTGTTTTSRSIDVSTLTNGNGVYSFGDLLPGTYSVSLGGSSTYLTTGGVSQITGITLAPGNTSSGNNLTLPGVVLQKVSLVYFFSFGADVPLIAPAQAPAGSGTGTGFSMSSASTVTPLLTRDTLTTGATSYLDLAGNFLDPDTTNTVVQFNSTFGNFQVQLFDADAPQTVSNFLANIQAGQYTDTLFTRQSSLDQASEQNPILTPYDVLQGGGFTVNSDSSGNVTSINSVAKTFQAIANEYNGSLHQNVTGTLAMANSGAGATATNQFFFNLDNSLQQQGGYAVFGQVVNNPTGSGVISGTAALNQFEYKNAANAFTPSDQTSANSAFYALPLANGYTPPSSGFPTGATTSNLATINSVSVVTPSKGQLTYSVTSSNTSIVTAALGVNTASSTFSANQLQLVAGSTTGTATVTVDVTDNRGETVQQTFTVTVNA